jgi:hypothetical protein
MPAIQPDEEVSSVVHLFVDGQLAEPGLKGESVELGASRHAPGRALRAPQVEQFGNERMEFFHGLSGRM